MNTAQAGLENADLERLNDKDKADLRQFLANEEQRAMIQSQTHKLTQMCWKRCVTGNIRNSKLDGSEETCLANCVERFLDTNFLTMQYLQKMRS